MCRLTESLKLRIWTFYSNRLVFCRNNRVKKHRRIVQKIKSGDLDKNPQDKAMHKLYAVILQPCAFRFEGMNGVNVFYNTTG